MCPPWTGDRVKPYLWVNLSLRSVYAVYGAPGSISSKFKLRGLVNLMTSHVCRSQFGNNLDGGRCQVLLFPPLLLIFA